MKKSFSGYIYIVACALIFSMVEVTLKAVAGVFHPLQITALRFLLGGIVLIPFALRSISRHQEKLNSADIRRFLWLGFLLVALSMVVYQMAVMYAKAGIVAIIFSCNSIFVTIFAYLFLHEPIKQNHIIALVIECIAILIIVNPFQARVNLVGAVLSILSAILFSFYSIAGKKLTPRLGGIAVSCFSFLFGSIELMLLLLFGRTGAGIGIYSALGLDIFVNVPILRGIPTSAVLWLLYIGIVNTGVGFVCHMMALEKTSAQEASLIFFLKPILAPIFALLFLKEEIALNVLVGIFCFVFGSSIAIAPGLMMRIKARKSEN